MSRAILALLGCLFSVLDAPRLDAQWSKPLQAQWYKVPATGQITVDLSEFWTVLKGPPPSGFVEGDAALTLEFSDGTTETIAFQGSGNSIWVELQSSHLMELSGTADWSQNASLTPGSVFQILSANPAQQYNDAVAFQGSGFGAYALGRVASITTNASQAKSENSGQSATHSPPLTTISPPVSSNIHAVIISGNSDPAKVISSANVTLTGGIVALGKDGSLLPATSAWSPGLKIIPDYALLTGQKIPPVTPNIIDVRIVKQSISADFPSPVPPGN